MLTRRQVLELGAGACLVAILGHVRSASAAEADATMADYLRREPWLPLVGGNVDVEAVTLRLAEVADLPQLAGRDDAFALEFTGPSGALNSGTHPFQHAALGSFEMFASPVDTALASEQRYEVVVDRSIGVPRVVPTANSTPPVSAPATASASAPTSSAPPSPHHGRRARRRLARRRAHQRQTKLRANR